MPALESILSRATGPDDRLLRGKAIECITLIGRVPASLSAGRSGDAIAHKHAPCRIVRTNPG